MVKFNYSKYMVYLVCNIATWALQNLLVIYTAFHTGEMGLSSYYHKLYMARHICHIVRICHHLQLFMPCVSHEWSREDQWGIWTTENKERNYETIQETWNILVTNQRNIDWAQWTHTFHSIWRHWYTILGHHIYIRPTFTYLVVLFVIIMYLFYFLL